MGNMETRKGQEKANTLFVETETSGLNSSLRETIIELNLTLERIETATTAIEKSSEAMITFIHDYEEDHYKPAAILPKPAEKPILRLTDHPALISAVLIASLIGGFLGAFLAQSF